jgi:multidrug efflux pump subunit AcrA (membrane-fusion protein)
LAAALAIGGYALWRNQAADAEKRATAIIPLRTAKAVSGVLNATIRVSGQTAAREYVNVTAPRLVGPESNRPLVILKLAQSGTMVKKGDLLLQIDGQSLLDHIDDVHSTVVQAESDIKKRRAEQAVEWENLQQSVRVAKAQMDKLKVDAKASEVRTAIDQELIKLSVEESEAQYNELLKEVELKRVSQAAEMKILDYTRERHTRHRDRHKKDVQRFTITSPMDGLAVVQSIWRGGEFQPIGEGDQIQAGQLIVKVVNPRSMQVEGNINQAESGSFRIGQHANVTLDAFPGVTLKAKVYSIGAIAVGGFRQQAYIRSIPVRIAIEDFDPRLIPDLSAGADVVVEAPDSTMVPLAAIHHENGRQIVYAKDGGRYVPRDVKLGLRNEIHAAVASGVNPGDEVALNYEVASR